MSNQFKSSTLLITAVVFIIWGILGLMDAKNYTYTGYAANDNVIYKVETGSPAEDAGMQVGDVIKKNGGIDVNDSKSFSERDRASIGDSREYVVERDGEEVTLTLIFAAQLAKDKTMNMLGTIMGFVFILLGVFTHRKINTGLSKTFALFSVLFGFIFMSGPYVPAGILNNIVNSLSTTFVFLSFAYMAIFTLQYTPQSSIVSTAKSSRKIFYPAILIILILWCLNLFQPDVNQTLDGILDVLFPLTIIFYFGTAVITLIRKYSKATSDERTATGLNYMLLAGIIGLTPILITFTITAIDPTIEIPGNDYVFFTFIFIPIFSSLALSRLSSK